MRGINCTAIKQKYLCLYILFSLITLSGCNYYEEEKFDFQTLEEQLGYSEGNQFISQTEFESYISNECNVKRDTILSRCIMDYSGKITRYLVLQTDNCIKTDKYPLKIILYESEKNNDYMVINVFMPRILENSPKLYKNLSAGVISHSYFEIWLDEIKMSHYKILYQGIILLPFINL